MICQVFNKLKEQMKYLYPSNNPFFSPLVLIHSAGSNYALFILHGRIVVIYPLVTLFTTTF